MPQPTLLKPSQPSWLYMLHLELHCHTGYSKGKKLPYEAFMTPEELIQTAKQKGLSAVAITDHDTCAAWPRAKKEAKKQSILFIPAAEVSSSDGHIIGLGLNEPISPSLPAEETLDLIHQQGALAIASHPFDLKHVGLRHQAAKADAIEIFNALSIDRFSNVRSRRFASRRHLSGVVGSDAHIPEALGSAVNHLQADDLDSALKAIQSARLTHTVSYQSPQQVVRWAYLRLSQSQPVVESSISSTYPQPKKWLAQKLLHQFLRSPEAKKWQALARFGISSAAIYSLFKNKCGFV